MAERFYLSLPRQIEIRDFLADKLRSDGPDHLEFVEGYTDETVAEHFRRLWNEPRVKQAHVRHIRAEVWGVIRRPAPTDVGITSPFALKGDVMAVSLGLDEVNKAIETTRKTFETLFNLLTDRLEKLKSAHDGTRIDIGLIRQDIGTFGKAQEDLIRHVGELVRERNAEKLGALGRVKVGA